MGGVITQVGLLDPSTYSPDAKVQTYRLGVAAWAKAKTIQLDGKGRLTTAARAIDEQRCDFPVIKWDARERISQIGDQGQGLLRSKSVAFEVCRVRRHKSS